MKNSLWGNIVNGIITLIQILEAPIFFALIISTLIAIIFPDCQYAKWFLDTSGNSEEVSSTTSMILIVIFIVGCVLIYVGYKIGDKFPSEDDPSGNDNIKRNFWDYM